MLNFFICVVLSVLSSFGMAIALVEKSDRWPLRSKRIKLQLLLRKIYFRLPRVLKCVTCSSFWLSLLNDILICIISLLFFDFTYFFWPLSGFITLGFTWFVIELLNILDKEQNIGVLIDKGEENENEN